MGQSANEDRAAFWDCYYRRRAAERRAGQSRAEPRPGADDWVDKHLALCPSAAAVLELGCGLGTLSERLHHRGFRVVATDISVEALARLNDRVPDITIRQVDLQQPLPFSDSEFDLAIADLCLHYFDSTTTRRVISEFARVLTPAGMVLARVNSDEDRNHGAGIGRVVEPGFYEDDGHFKRFFDEAMVEHFFAGWSIQFMERREISRFGPAKMVIEIAAMPGGRRRDGP